jgi:hypothetical protein
MGRAVLTPHILVPPEQTRPPTQLLPILLSHLPGSLLRTRCFFNVGHASHTSRPHSHTTPSHELRPSVRARRARGRLVGEKSRRGVRSIHPDCDLCRLQQGVHFASTYEGFKINQTIFSSCHPPGDSKQPQTPVLTRSTTPGSYPSLRRLSPASVCHPAEPPC